MNYFFINFKFYNSRLNIAFYWYTFVSSFLMLILNAIIWFKKLWDFFSPVLECEPHMVNPPQNKILRRVYDFSFNIMSNAIWRTLIYLFVVMMLVTVSMLHLADECRGYENINKGVDSNEIIDQSPHELSSCINPWVISM